MFLVFGDPRVGTPLKVVVWQSADGKVCLSFNSPEYLMQRHGMDAPPFKPVEQFAERGSPVSIDHKPPTTARAHP